MRLHITCEAHAERTQHEHVCHLILLSNTKSAVVRTIDTTGFWLKNTELIYFSLSRYIALIQVSYMIVAKSAS